MVLGRMASSGSGSLAEYDLRIQTIKQMEINDRVIFNKFNSKIIN